MEFRERLQKATDRGRQMREAKRSEEAAKALSEEECRRLHSNYRLGITEQIEKLLRELSDNFPGFRVESIVDETGWGSLASRDDLGISDGRRANLFSRLRIVVSPFSKYHVLEIVAKGTVRNKEAFSRNHYQRLADVDLESFRELLELWVLDYAEMFAAAG